jgi:hypothetical protein
VDATTFKPNQPLPRSYILTVGFQREIRGGWLVSADYVNSKGRNLIRMVDLNPIVPPDFVRVDPNRGSLLQFETTGFSNYHGLLVSADKRFARRAHLGGSYTLATYKTTNGAEFGFHQDDRTPNESYGYGGNDMRHRAVVNGTVDLKWGFQVSSILSANSGVPFDIVTGYDNNLNGNANDRPDLAPGAHPGTDDMRNRSSFLDPGERPGNLPRNSGRELHWWQLDARFSKKFVFDRYRLELMAEAFNLDNHVNYTWTMGNLSSSLFGQPIAADPARQVQLAIRFQF